jgi:hypothetical protein
MTQKIRLSTVGADDSPPLYGGKVDPTNSVVTARGLYEELKSERDGYLRRARQAASLSIPALFPEEGTTGSTMLPTPWQALGSKGVLGLSAKLLLTLFPPGQEWFRRVPTPQVIADLRQTFKEGSQEFTDAKTALEGELAAQDRDVVDALEAAGYRTELNEGLKQLVVAGNFLLHMHDDGKILVHRLDRYVVNRDCDGNILDIILCQSMDRRSLPRAAKAVYAAYASSEDERKRSVDVYTWVRRDEDRPTIYRVCQEILGHIIPGSEGVWPVNKSPMFPVAINRIPGEPYGRGHIEMHIGDLVSHDGLSQSIVQGTAIMARTVYLVDEGGQAQKKQLAEAENGDYLDGRKDDVHALTSEKAFDLQVARTLLADIAKRMDEAFLNASSIQRDAERVTAEEIRLLAQELDNSFGGMYSLLSRELQYPLAVRKLFVMQRKGEIANVPEKFVKTVVVAGLAALGRNSDLDRLHGVLVRAKDAVGEQAVAAYTNVGELLARLSTAGGVDAKGLWKTGQQVAQEQQQATARDLAGKVGSQVVKTQGDLAMHANPQPAEGGAEVA